MRSLGCPKNSVDSEKTLEAFAARGLLMTSEAELADIVIINTCGFINDAKEESINTIIELAELKKKSRTIKLVVMGCLSERYKEDLFKQIPEIDHIYGVDELNKIISELTSNIEINYNSKVPLRISSSSKGWSYLKISEGCSNTCSFCIIPKIRGPYKSRNQQSVIAEAKSLSALGVKELILVAQDSTIFGADLHMKDGLAKLLEKLSALEEIDWIRALYMYPALVTDALISVMAKGSKVLPYFDIPIQHGSNSILQSMGRPERRDDIRRLITKI
ncbi:MAG TPA: MiaB/RimO family radical SAM methylthiotransferase, partial [Nitrospinota bacterium]|nr:MiaB/RimO family radical SAM methylthiotransferase [Nitrospinota bacterium]